MSVEIDGKKNATTMSETKASGTERYSLEQLKSDCELRTALFDKKFNLWQADHGGAWWRPPANGYTTDIKEAAVYDFEEAWLLCNHCGPEKGIVFEVADVAAAHATKASGAEWRKTKPTKGWWWYRADSKSEVFMALVKTWANMPTDVTLYHETCQPWHAELDQVTGEWLGPLSHNSAAAHATKASGAEWALKNARGLLLAIKESFRCDFNLPSGAMGRARIDEVVKLIESALAAPASEAVKAELGNHDCEYESDGGPCIHCGVTVSAAIQYFERNLRQKPAAVEEIAREAADELHGVDKGRKNPALEALKKRTVEIILSAIRASQKASGGLIETGKLLDALEFARGAIVDALFCEDGLYQSDGMAVVRMIDEQLSKHGRLPQPFDEKTYLSPDYTRLKKQGAATGASAVTAEETEQPCERCNQLNGIIRATSEEMGELRKAHALQIENLQGELNEARDQYETATADNCRTIHEQRLEIKKLREALLTIEKMPWPNSNSPYAKIARAALASRGEEKE